MGEKNNIYSLGGGGEQKIAQEKKQHIYSTHILCRVLCSIYWSYLFILSGKYPFLLSASKLLSSYYTISYVYIYIYGIFLKDKNNDQVQSNVFVQKK